MVSLIILESCPILEYEQDMNTHLYTATSSNFCNAFCH